LFANFETLLSVLLQLVKRARLVKVNAYIVMRLKSEVPPGLVLNSIIQQGDFPLNRTNPSRFFLMPKNMQMPAMMGKDKKKKDVSTGLYLACMPSLLRILHAADLRIIPQFTFVLFIHFPPPLVN
jgi:hypothetical protein